MCGISGGISLDWTSNEDTLIQFTQRAIKKLHHRGPDSNSIKTFGEGNVCFGHNRLKIVELTDHGLQPMESELSAIVFNGEIYNHDEIRRHLINLGIKFQSRSDTEVLLKFLDCYGTSNLNALNGMFSFAYYNKSEKSLQLVRDRFGVKPLYYLVDSGSLYFGSEMRVFSNLGMNELNLDLIQSFIQDTASDFGGDTVYRNLSQVKPGHVISISGGVLNQRKWYEPNTDFQVSRLQEFNNQFEEILWNSISLRLKCDVPVCITLSGGLDSSTIYTLIKERTGQKITVFTFDHPGRKTSELARVRSLTDKYGDELIVVTDPAVSKTSIEEITSDLEILEFPIWSFSSRAYRQMYEAIASRGFRVVIEGHGGDEILGGYQYMVESLLIESLRTLRAPTVLRTLKIISGLQGKESIINPSTMRLLYQQIRLLISRNPKRRVSFFGERTFAIDTRILPIILRAFDRLSMDSSVESRFPLLDYRVVELSLFAKNKFLMGPSGTKQPLRAILEKYGNLDVSNFSEKLGFSSDLENMHRSRQLRADLITQLEIAMELHPNLAETFARSRSFFQSDHFDEHASYNASKNAMLAIFLSNLARP